MFQQTLEKIEAWSAHLGPTTTSGLRIVVILLVGWLAILLLRRAIRLLHQRLLSRIEDGEAERRVATLVRVGRSLIGVAISLICLVLILSDLGISVAPILGAAGVVGIAVGFGAQSLVKDLFGGLFILFENQIRHGDIVSIGEHSGAVEQITLRYVRLRDYEGAVHFVPNGSITSIINRSLGFANAVFDIGVAYKEDIDQVMAVMRAVAADLRADPEFAGRILDDIEIAGVENFADSAVMIRARIRVVGLEQFNVRREYLRRLKYAFDQRGIEIPFPQMTFHLRRPGERREPVSERR